jgi:hypothetical protein
MKNKLLFIMLLIYSSSVSQTKTMASFNPGSSLYNSENSMRTIGSKTIGWFRGFSVAFEKENFWGIDVHGEYCYAYSKTQDVINYNRTNSSGIVIGTTGADLIIAIHNIDLAVIYHINSWLSISGGPSLGLTYRTLKIDNLSESAQQNVFYSFEDRLASLCGGVNGSINLELPLQGNSEYFFLYSSLKLRYLHSLLFDKRGRNLDNYYQSFLSGQLNIGVGNCF